MTTIDREALFALFAPDAHASIEKALQRDDITGLAVYESEAGKRRAVPAQTAAAPTVDREGWRLIAVYLKDRLRHALAYLKEHPEATPYAAAQRYGINPRSLYPAIRRQQKQAMKAAQPVCPCCGQALPKNTEAA
jgi:hypothetical protein